MGRPRKGKFVPTESDHNTVFSMVAGGFRHDAIARCLGTSGVSKATLERHFKRELEAGAEKANAIVANIAFRKAQEGIPAFVFFWLKCRAGWREVQQIEHVGSQPEVLKQDAKTLRTLLERAMKDQPPEVRYAMARRLMEMAGENEQPQ